MARLLLVDDHAAYRETFAAALERDASVRVVLRAGSLAEAREAIAGFDDRIDIALVGQDLPDGDATELRPYLQAFQPSCHLVILRAGTRRHDRVRAIASGAAGIFPRSAPFEAVTDGIKQLKAGKALIPRADRIALLKDAAGALAEEQAIRSALARLTPRESEILQALACGMSDKETAATLGVSTKTVAAHMASLLRKLGVDSRLKAVLVAIRFRVVTLE
jgi:DNA-binding NarL/FixJ family response regulator